MSKLPSMHLPCKKIFCCSLRIEHPDKERACRKADGKNLKSLILIVEENRISLETTLHSSISLGMYSAWNCVKERQKSKTCFEPFISNENISSGPSIFSQEVDQICLPVRASFIFIDMLQK